MEQLAAKLNAPVIEVLTESKSAKEPGRPVFNSMMQRLYRGEAAGIICWKLDRLARNPVDGGSIIWAIKQHGIKVMTPAQSYAREEDNIILMYIEFGMAQKYVDDLSKNVKRGLKTKLENGWYPCAAPPGYLNNTVKLSGENNLIKDPERFPPIRRMWDLMLTGMYSPLRILDIATTEWGLRTRPMRTKGNRRFAPSAIYKIFTRPFYYGYFEFPKGSGKWFRGKHEPMVTEAEYDRVQELLGRQGNPRPRIRDRFAFTGIIRCGECNGMVTAEEKHQVICSNCRLKFANRATDACPRCRTPIAEMLNPRFLKYVYYHCTKRTTVRCSQRCVSATELESQIEGYLSRIQISKRFEEWAIKHLHELHDMETAARGDALQSQQKLYQDCLRRLDNLVALKTSPANSDGSLLSDQEYGRDRLKLLTEKAALEAYFKKPGQMAEQALALSQKTFEFAQAVRERFAKGNPKTKKEILTTVGSNLTLAARKLSIQARKPFSIIETGLADDPTTRNPIEPEITEDPQEQNGPCNSLSSQESALGEEVRTLQHITLHVVQQVYRFFQSFKGTPHSVFPGWSHDGIVEAPCWTPKTRSIVKNGK